MEARESGATAIFPFEWQEEISRKPVEVARFMSKFGNAEVLSIVAFEDGSHDILRNGRSVAAHPWTARELDDCLETLCRLMGADMPISR